MKKTSIHNADRLTRAKILSYNVIDNNINNGGQNIPFALRALFVAVQVAIVLIIGLNA